MRIKTHRAARLSGAALACAMALALAPSIVHAVPPVQQTTQVPGFYRMALGDFQVTALYDGYVDLDTKLLKNVGAKDVQGLLARMFIDNSKGVQTAVNGYLVHTGKNLVLVDAGSARCFGPTMGGLLANVRAAGYSPEDVDTVLLTHLHPDHACGLASADGKAAFANAEVRVAKADADFWLDEAVAAKAPKDKQPFFKMARDAVAPYVAAGRLKPYAPGEAPLPGVSVVAAGGHTPGHSGYLFASRGQRLLVWGDLVHSHAAQFARPEIAFEFDVDAKQAIASRKRLFADAAKDKLWVAGAHLPFPGLGHVRAEGKAYAWVPAEYGPLRADR
ncbi:MBL fold metallo-hydrolase [Crenobacter cavernae]|uniref:MBL fold metallo-hydrolase n=1 Tax=Crenobacter cavernae TaxID=2290923 RepID=A0A345Y548_9NEIS|nr:MBL fold metallo-hydrolase [Crenobacter cavernae]AXK39050.1 MBL fold metallo-hydrolase [Crenobacter cavernae]